MISLGKFYIWWNKGLRVGLGGGGSRISMARRSGIRERSREERGLALLPRLLLGIVSFRAGGRADERTDGAWGFSIELTFLLIPLMPFHCYGSNNRCEQQQQQQGRKERVEKPEINQFSRCDAAWRCSFNSGAVRRLFFSSSSSSCCFWH